MDVPTGGKLGFPGGIESLRIMSATGKRGKGGAARRPREVRSGSDGGIAICKTSQVSRKAPDATRRVEPVRPPQVEIYPEYCPAGGSLKCVVE